MRGEGPEISLMPALTLIFDLLTDELGGRGGGRERGRSAPVLGRSNTHKQISVETLLRIRRAGACCGRGTAALRGQCQDSPSPELLLELCLRVGEGHCIVLTRFRTGGVGSSVGRAAQKAFGVGPGFESRRGNGILCVVGW